ncbi:MAG TPA: autotransporter-associated beta strand repeat-containing protein [Candidatus Acidoferrum sp.]|nr:autotransporter-associated beta strand repeat-containing protein [Candidatus Acidoferrum sp.]
MKTIREFSKWTFFVIFPNPSAIRHRVLIILACAGLICVSARSAVLTWSGSGGANANWNNSANWGGAGTPQNFDTLIFPAGQPNQTNTNNLANLNLNQIVFNGAGGGYSIYGNAFMVTNSLVATNTTGANTIYNNLTFSNANITILVSNGVSLNLAGSLGGSVFVSNVTKIGLGTLTYSGSTANSYTNLTTVKEGELDLAKVGNVAAIAPYGAGLMIGNGIGTVIVRYQGGYQIFSIVTPITITNSGVLDLNGYSDTVSPLTLGGGQITTGNGTLTIAGTVTNTGAATVSGNLQLSPPVLFTNAPSAQLFMNAAVHGAADLVKTGQGYLYLTASNSYTGLTVVRQGILYVQNPWALGTTNNGTVVSNKATLVLDGNIGITNEPLTLNGPGISGAWGALDVESGINTWAGPITNNADSTLDTWNSSSALHINGPITGPGGLELFGSAAGGGSHYFDGPSANSYTGTTIVDTNTTLVLEKIAPAANGAIPGNLVITGTVASVTGIPQINPAADVTINSGALLHLGPPTSEVIDALSGSGTVSLDSSSTSLVVGNANGSSTFSGVITGAGSLYKNGSGTLTLAGAAANTYSGITVVSGGILILNKTVSNGTIPGSLYINSGATVRLGASEQIADSASISIGSGCTLDLNSYNETIGNYLSLYEGNLMTGTGLLTLAPNNTVYEDGIAYSYIYGKVNIGSGNSTWDVEGDLLVPASLSGTADLIKTGQFVLMLDASNSYSGLTIIENGYLEVQNPWALGSTSSGTIVTNWSSLLLEGGIGITNEPLTLYGSGGGFGDLGCGDETTNYWVGPITVNGNCIISVIEASAVLHLSGPISGPGGIEMFTNPQGNLTVGGHLYLDGSAANTYAGTTTVDTGPHDTTTLVLNKTAGVNAVPTNLVISGTVLLAANSQIANGADVLVNTGGLLEMGTYYDFINTLEGAGAVHFGSGGWLNIGGLNGTSQFDGSFTGIGYAPGYTIGKSGSGTLTLTGGNTFSAGVTHVFTGKLAVNGFQPQSPVIVDSSATLGGIGTVGSITANGTIAPGNSPGILTTSNVVFSATGTFSVDLNGPTPGVGYDQLNVRGTNSLANATLVVNSGPGLPGAIGDQFIIVNNDGADAITGTFNGLPNGAQFTAGGDTFRINYNGGDGNDVVLTLWGVTNKTMTLNAVDRGWYNDTGFHNPGNGNYLAGRLGPRLYNDWFVFNVPVFSGSIVQAELIINSYNNTSLYGQETYILHQVTNSIADLEGGGSGLTGIYNDLGDGPIYGIRSASVLESGEKMIIPLNVTFLNDATAASGGQIAIGGTVFGLDPTNNRNVFLNSLSAPASDVQLRLTFGTAMAINGFASGWYNSAGTHTATWPNYAVGEESGGFYRNFFVFGLPALSGQLINAQLLLNSYTNTSLNGFETYQLHDVTTSIVSLTNNASSATNTYADLGSGTCYGGRDVYVAESGLKISIPLNSDFLAAAQASSGGNLALGGCVTSLDPAPNTERLFGYSGVAVPADFQLWLGFLTAPVANPSFAGGTPTCLGNNRYQFILSGTIGTTNEIQASFDFQNWDFIRDVGMSSATATFYYTNTVFPYRFFRARPLP